jgi:hypothetical protein
MLDAEERRDNVRRRVGMAVKQRACAWWFSLGEIAATKTDASSTGFTSGPPR